MLTERDRVGGHASVPRRERAIHRLAGLGVGDRAVGIRGGGERREGKGAQRHRRHRPIGSSSFFGPDNPLVMVVDLFGSQIQADLIGAVQWRIYHGPRCGEGVRVCGVRQFSLAAFSFPSPTITGILH